MVRSDQTWHPSRRQLSHAQNVMQDMPHGACWDAYCLSYLAHLQSAVCYYKIVDFCYVYLSCNSYRGVWTRLVKNRRETTFKLVKPIFNGRRRKESPYTKSKQSLRDFPFKNKKTNHRPILLFFHFLKYADTQPFTRAQKRNNESDLAKLFTITV